MRRSAWGSMVAVALAGLATACGNPAVDPDATFTAKGEVVDAAGQPLANAEVRLVKYWSAANLLAPVTEDLFAETPRGEPDLGLGVAVVQSVRTDASGKYEMTFQGRDIASPNGYTTAEGLVEVATAVVVVRDPADDSKQSGVYTYPKLYMQADKIWDAGKLNLWNAEAVADVSDALVSGQIELKWKKIERGSSMVKNVYRVWIQGERQNTARLVIGCNQGAEVMGGCAEDPQDGTKLVRHVSAYSVGAFYSDNDGRFAAYLQGNSPDYRYVARFRVEAPVPNIRDTRDPVAIEEVWAVGSLTDQRLSGAAIDGDPKTREAITNNATAIYAKLSLGLITDAGLLNSLVKEANKGCLVLEFSVSAFSSIGDAKGSRADQWETKGRFCGENGGRDEMSALASFDTTSSDGVVAAWMRIRAVPDGMAAGMQFESVGEVAVFRKKAR